MTRLAQNMDTTALTGFPFTVYNLAGTARSVTAEVKIELDRYQFSEKWPDEALAEWDQLELSDFKVCDGLDKEYALEIKEVKNEFGYDLPKDAFRVAYMSRNLYATVYLPRIAALSYQTLTLMEGKSMLPQGEALATADGKRLENAYLKAVITEKGTLTVTNKRTGKVYTNQLIFEETGDVGNEYVYKQSADGKALYSTNFPHRVELVKNSETEAIIQLTHEMAIPVSEDERLSYEQETIVDITRCKAERAIETAPFTLTTLITLKKDSQALEFQTSFDNQMKDHRLRVLFATDLMTETHTTESIFEAVVRPNKVSEHWKNPTNPQHEQAYVNLNDGVNGLTVGNVAINEYEILEDKTIALTLLRCVGEMGDWGYFPTLGAQCLGNQKVHYSLFPHDASDYFESLRQAVALKVPVLTKQLPASQSETLPASAALATISSDAFFNRL